MIEFVQGDIFESKSQVLVNPVNCVGVMGKGLALGFKKAYPRMFSGYRARCEEGMMPGDIYEWPTGNLFGTKFVLSLATKNHWRDPSDIRFITRGLENLREWIALKMPGSVAIPALGCGLGQLDWGLVKARILFELECVPICITVYEPMA